MHAQGIPGAHVILRFGRQPEKEAFERMLGIAASCAAYHSRGHRQEFVATIGGVDYINDSKGTNTDAAITDSRL